MSEPTADIYRGGTSYPPVDGVSIWPIIINPHQHNRSDAAHKSLWLSNEVLMRGQYKLLVMQPSIEKMEKKDDPIKNGWKQLDESWLNPNVLDFASGETVISYKSVGFYVFSAHAVSAISKSK